MYIETWKFYRIVYSLAILWCCMIRANGDTDTNIVLNSRIFKILPGIQNGTGVNPLISVFYVNIANGSFNLNIPFNFSESKTNATGDEKPIKTVTEPIKTVTEPIEIVTEQSEIVIEPIKTVTEPIDVVTEQSKFVTEPIQTVPEGYILTEGFGYHKLYKTRRNWDDARKACKAENADLAVINSEEEIEVLHQIMTDNGNADMAYIGLYYINENIGWMTVTGLSPENAGFDLPSYWWNIMSGTSQCAVFELDSTIDYWKCSNKYYYICEIPL